MDEESRAFLEEELAFDSGQVLDRVAAHGDLFAGVETLEQELPTG